VNHDSEVIWRNRGMIHEYSSILVGAKGKYNKLSGCPLSHLDSRLASPDNMATIFAMGVCILLRVYQIKSLDKPSFVTSIVRVFYFIHSFMFTTCFGPDQRPFSGDII
jgi:hypothetical protein